MKTPLHGGVALFDKRVSGKMTADYTVVPSPEEQPNQIMFFPISEEIPTWHDDAVCAQTDPEAFFPEKGGSTREAKRICVNCTVKQECLEYALDFDERFGIWGGLSERERRRLKLQTKLVVLPVPPIQLVPSIERPAAMKDEARFPMVRAFLRKRQGHPFMVYGGERGRVPGELAAAAKIDSVKELRQVLRKMGRAEDDTQVTEDPSGTLWVELVQTVAIPTAKFTAPVISNIKEIAATKPASPVRIVETFIPVETVVDEDEQEIEDLVFERIADSIVAFDDSRHEVNLDAIEAPVEDINDEVARLLRAEFDAVLAEEAEARKAALSDEAIDEIPREVVTAIVTAEIVVDSLPIEDPVSGDDITSPREELVILQAPASTDFVEMEAPAGYVTPPAPPKGPNTLSDERIRAILEAIASKPEQRLFGQGITAEVAEKLGAKTVISVSVFVSQMVALGYIGRVLSGKKTIVIWLRQAGWDWLQTHNSSETVELTTEFKEPVPEAVEVEILVQNEEPKIEQTSSPIDFVEMELPEGYVNEDPPNTLLLTATPERVSMILGYLAEQPGGVVRDATIVKPLATILGASNVSVSTLVKLLVSQEMIGRIMTGGSKTTVTWLRQAGVDWLQAHNSGENVEASVVEQVVVPALVDEPPVKLVEPEPVIEEVEDPELVALREEKAVLVASLTEALGQRDEAIVRIKELQTEFRDHVRGQMLSQENELTQLEAVLMRIESPVSRHLSSVEARSETA